MTDTVHLTRDDSEDVAFPVAPLHWWAKTEGPLISGPEGQLGNLARHGIHANGEVFPSVLVTGDPNFPEWHVYAVLDGWDGGERPQK